MTENSDEFFTQKHERLARIASAATIFAWIALVFFFLIGISGLLQIFTLIDLQGIQLFLQDNLSSAFNIFGSTLSNFLSGVIYWLVLKGISLGLNMIVETDLNFRGIQEGENNE